ncbi:MAG: hypothetical protein BroJett018_20600 [Chloroflexota bacterium]|nr:MAG: hypothetical protein BroJett018_20600 [Chloroflexota bacterium]
MKQHNVISIVMVMVFLLMLATLACTGELTSESVTIGELPQYVCPSATPRATDTPLPTSPPTYAPYFTANLTNYQVGNNINSVTVQWLAQNAGTIYLNYSGSMTVSPFYWSGARSLSIGYSAPNQPAQNGFYTLFIPVQVSSATLQVWAANTGSPQVLSVYRIIGNVGQFYPPPSWGAPPPIYPTPRPTYTPYPTPTPYIRTNDYFLNDPIYTAPHEQALNIRFRVTEMQSVVFQGTPTPNPPKTPVPGTNPTPIYPESLYIWTFEVKNFSNSQTYTIYPPAQSFVSSILLSNGVQQQVLLFPTYTAARLAGFTDFAGYQAHNLAPGQQVTLRLAVKGLQGSLYRVSWVMDASGRPTPANGAEATPIVAGSNIVSWINTVNTECIGEIAEPS